MRWTISICVMDIVVIILIYLKCVCVCVRHWEIRKHGNIFMSNVPKIVSVEWTTPAATSHSKVYFERLFIHSNPGVNVRGVTAHLSHHGYWNTAAAVSNNVVKFIHLYSTDRNLLLLFPLQFSIWPFWNGNFLIFSFFRYPYSRYSLLSSVQAFDENVNDAWWWIEQYWHFSILKDSRRSKAQRCIHLHT